MPRFARRVLVLTGIALALAAGQAAAQDNLDAGKKPAQLFANDCSACHKSPAGLSKAPGLFGLESFLREHYTASRQTAAMIANYLRSVDAEQAAAGAGAKRRKSEPRSRGDKPAKRQESKPESASAPKDNDKAAAKPVSDKPAEPKPAESKPAESKPSSPPASTAPAASSDKSN